jgi:hypothetical protein
LSTLIDGNQAESAVSGREVFRLEGFLEDQHLPDGERHGDRVHRSDEEKGAGATRRPDGP